MTTVLTISIAIGATKMGQSSTIVVDASDYIKKELQASIEQNIQLDNEYQLLLGRMMAAHKHIDSLKVTLIGRNKLIHNLKAQSNEVSTPIIYSDSQHDSLFTEGLN
jgi:hypothetical protein